MSEGEQAERTTPCAAMGTYHLQHRPTMVLGRKVGIAGERKNSALPVQPVSLVVLMRSHVGERLEGDLDKGRRVVAVGWGGQCPGQQQAEAWQWWPPGTCQPAIKVPSTWATAILNLRWLMELSTRQYSDFSLNIGLSTAVSNY